MGSARRWHNGRIFTGRRFAESLLVDDGRVVAAGTSAEVQRDAPTGTETIDLGGRMIVPGLIDAHLHLARVTIARDSLDVRTATTLPGLIELVRRWASDHPDGPLVAYGWTAGQFGREASPTRQDLDEAAGDRPLVIFHASGHAAVVNSAALRELSIDRSTPDPRGGRIGRDREGNPDGSLFESAIRSVEVLTSKPSALDPESLSKTLAEIAALGLTSVASMNAGRGECEALRSLRDSGRLGVRVRLYLNRDWFMGEGRPDAGAPPDEWLRITGVKGFADGAFGPRTAWLSAPYLDAPGETGLPAGNDAELTEAFRLARSLGLAPALHAIGDRAVQQALDLLEPWTSGTGPPARIEHAALTPPSLLPRLARVRPALVVQPGFVWSDHWLFERLGRARARWAYAFRTLSDRGHLLAGSSDAPYDPLDPWRGLRAAVARWDALGHSANPEVAEALPAVEAFRLYTSNAGRVLGESDLGELETGARADLLVVEAPHPSAAIAAGSSAVRETWIGGERVSSVARPAKD
jgi:predicted amidohydrolase YtcJ